MTCPVSINRTQNPSHSHHTPHLCAQVSHFLAKCYIFWPTVTFRPKCYIFSQVLHFRLALFGPASGRLDFGPTFGQRRWWSQKGNSHWPDRIWERYTPQGLNISLYVPVNGYFLFWTIIVVDRKLGRNSSRPRAVRKVQVQNVTLGKKCNTWAEM